MLTKNVLGSILNKAISKGFDFAEIYEEDILSNRLYLTEGTIGNIISGRNYGIGIRMIKELNSIYTYTNETSLNGLLLMVEQASQVLNCLDSNNKFLDINLNEVLNKNMHKVLYVPSSYSTSKKVKIMKNAYKASINVSNLIKQVKITLVDFDKEIMIANSEGLYTRDRKCQVRIFINSIASYNGKICSGTEAPGKLKGYEYFNEINIEDYAKSASHEAINMVKANKCPAGVMPVIIESGFGGVIFHEACGHLLEAEAISRGNSVFAGKLGKQIASKNLTVIDDGRIPNEWGSINIDDEGTPAKKNILIKNGILKNYLVDRLNGKRMGIVTTGNSRRESYKYSPTSRMTNTYIAPGDDSREKIFNSVDKGLYAKKIGGGSVNTITGEFNFFVREGYFIKNGNIIEPVQGAILIGNGPEILMDVDMIGKRLEIGTGMCCASSGNIPITVGQPLIKMSKIKVGGNK
jgi:TldD protein